ncbi:MAG: VCBS repeat-containing protein [Pirellulales bacterium]|nr:VCBS repeat-containing protein [Pirellulales bacterium]
MISQLAARRSDARRKGIGHYFLDGTTMFQRSDVSGSFKSLRLRRRGARRKYPGQRMIARRTACEALEPRNLLTTTLFIDFGEGFAGGKMLTTVGQLQGVAIGPDLGLPGTDVLEFQSLRSEMSKVKFDYNADGLGGTNSDYTFLKSTIMETVARIYEPFDVDVKEAKARSIFDVVSAFNLNTFDPTGEHDAYVFVASIIDTTVGESITDLIGIYGIASGIDLTSGPGGLPGNNETDESVVVCADAVLEDSSRLGFDAGAAMSNVVAHEAGHTFGLRHTVGVATPLVPDQALQNQSDIIRAGGDNPPVNLFNIGMITRYNLMADYDALGTNINPLVTVNSYEKLASDPDIGLNPDFGEYVTGTGAFDDISITRVNDTTALVSVQTYRDSSFSFNAAIDAGPNTYLIDYTGGIVVDTGRSSDRIAIDSALGVNITVRGSQGDNELTVFANGNPNVTFTPEADPAFVPGIPGATSGRIVTTGGGFGTTTIDFTEVTSNSRVVLDGFNKFDYLGPQTGSLNLSMSGASITGKVNGPQGTVGIVGVRFIDVANVTIDTSVVNPAESIDTNDQLVITGAGFAAPGLQNFTFTPGRGNDTLVLEAPNFTLPVLGGAFLYDGGSGNNTIATNSDTSFILNDGSLESTSGGVVQLMRVELARLAGGAGDNSFYVQTWAGTGSIFGLEGDDNFVFGAGADIDTFTGQFTVDGGDGNDTLTLDDSATFDTVNYNIGETRVAGDDTTPTPFGRIYWEPTLDNLVMTGTLGKNIDFVTPSKFLTIKIDALDPPSGTPPLDGDQLSIFFGDAAGRRLIDRGTGNGIWTFTSGEKEIYFENIEFMGSLVAAAAEAGDGRPLVKVYNSLTNELVYKFYAYDQGFKGGVQATMADVNGDGILDVIVAPGAGRSGEVKVFDSALMQALAAFDPRKLVESPDAGAQIGPSIFPEGVGYRSGLHVAAGDVDGDGDIDVITSRDTGRGKIRVYEKTAADTYLRTLTFTPYSKSEGVTKGAVLAVGDVDGDGRDEIVTAPGAGASARIKVWEGESGVRTRQFFGFESRFRNGVSLAVGDADGDGRDEIFVAAGAGGGSRVRTFSQYGTLRNEFKAYSSGNTNAPVQLAARASDPQDKVALYTAQGNDGRTSVIRVLNPLTGTTVDSFFETDPDFGGGIAMG